MFPGLHFKYGADFQSIKPFYYINFLYTCVSFILFHSKVLYRSKLVQSRFVRYFPCGLKTTVNRLKPVQQPARNQSHYPVKAGCKSVSSRSVCISISPWVALESINILVVYFHPAFITVCSI